MGIKQLFFGLWLSTYIAIGIHGQKSLAPKLTTAKKLSIEPVRIPANTKNRSCKELAEQFFLEKNVKIDQSKYEKRIQAYWQKHNEKNFKTTVYKKIKAIAKTAKVKLMNFNGNERPIYYIENDQAYIKIFKYLEDNSNALIDTSDDEYIKLEKEILSWVTYFHRYKTDLNSYYEEFAMNTAVMKEIAILNKQKDLKFPIKLTYVRFNNERVPYDYIDDIYSREEFDEILVRLKGRNYKLKGSLGNGNGIIEDRALEQAVLRTRLDFLYREIRDLVANKKELEVNFKPIFNLLKKAMMDTELNPSIKNLMKLEIKEFRAEWAVMYETVKVRRELLTEYSQSIIDNMSERHKQKLGIGSERKWANSMRLGRWGLLFTGATTIVSMQDVRDFFVKGYEIIFYDQDAMFGIVQADSEYEFQDRLNQYLKENYPLEMIKRIRVKDQQVFLENFDPRKSDEVEILSIIKDVVEKRKKYLSEIREIEKVQEELNQLMQPEEKEEPETNDSKDDSKDDSAKNDSITPATDSSLIKIIQKK